MPAGSGLATPGLDCPCFFFYHINVIVAKMEPPSREISYLERGGGERKKEKEKEKEIDTERKKQTQRDRDRTCFLRISVFLLISCYDVTFL
jgi:hypothetical protein